MQLYPTTVLESLKLKEMFLFKWALNGNKKWDGVVFMAFCLEFRDEKDGSLSMR